MDNIKETLKKSLKHYSITNFDNNEDLWDEYTEVQYKCLDNDALYDHLVEDFLDSVTNLAKLQMVVEDIDSYTEGTVHIYTEDCLDESINLQPKDVAIKMKYDRETLFSQKLLSDLAQKLLEHNKMTHRHSHKVFEFINKHNITIPRKEDFLDHLTYLTREIRYQNT